MPSLYKYLPKIYVDDFVSKGSVLFRTLSYFRDYEDKQIRGDEFEGTKIYRPQQGLSVTKTATQEKIILPHSFESTANEDDIFVFCLSTVLSEDLASKFQTDTCIEILNPAKFISGIRAALLRRPSIKSKKLVHGEVKYYASEELPIVDWALPEKIAMSKLDIYRPQQEYRFAFAVNDAFQIGKTQVNLVLPNERKVARATVYPERLFKLGKLTNICKTHRFD